VYLLPGANQIDVADGIYRTLTEAKQFFPPDVDYKIVYDTTPAVKESIKEILVTLYEAAVLVILVVFLFLQSVRATLIPLFAIPVSLVGTFLCFPLFGFSINTLSMFGLVLAIGTVVDDAIVVVEAVMHHIEQGMSPREATKKAMKEVSGPVVGTALIMAAVFGPVAFMGGLVGMMYKQFALTIAVSVQISAFVALSLSPAMCVLLLKPGKGPGRGPLGLFFRGFNKVFDVGSKGYVKVAALLIRRSFLSLILLGGVCLASVTLGGQLPRGFVPDEDQGIFLANVQLPNAASLERSAAVCKQMEATIEKTPALEAYNSMGGLAFLTNSFAPNVASAAIGLKHWGERPDTPLPVALGFLQKEFAKIPEAVVFPFAPPTIPGFGAAGGFTFILQDRSGTLSVEQLTEETGKFIETARKRPELLNLFTPFDARVPQLRVDLDREKARKQGVPINDVFTALQSVLGGTYVNDFNRFGRLYRVYLQADSQFRQRPEDINLLYVRSQTTGEMVPLSTLVDVVPVSGAELTVRFNMFRSVEISGSSAPGYSSAQAMTALEETAATVLPPEMGYAYSGLSYQEKQQPPVGPVLLIGGLCIFLLLAAMYESWALPWSVILTTPLVILGSFFGVWLGKFDNNVFVQVGILMLIGLSAKTAILIVEFAKMKRDAGATAFEAAREAAQLRFRPILMTAFTFVLGVVPLMLATGSGANSRRVMGTAVFWGMIVFVLLGLFLTPALYELVERITSIFRRKRSAPAAPETTSPPADQGAH
jgi:HAE1 family hydrophobic/amphiphilic exporter-1